MNRKKIAGLATVLVILLALLALAVMNNPSAAGDDTGTPPGPGSGSMDPPVPTGGDEDQPTCQPEATTLCVEKCAQGFWNKEVVYDWMVKKEIEVASEDNLKVCSEHEDCLLVPNGESVTLEFSINADRYILSETDEYGVQGYVSVKNTGEYPTENLKILDVVQVQLSDGTWEDFEVKEIGTCTKPVLQPCEQFSYPYEIVFDQECNLDAAFRNVARVTITNYVDHTGEEWGPGVCAEAKGVAAEFTLPCEPNLTEINECATVLDELSVPEGFSCDPSVFKLVTLCGSEKIEYCVKVTNQCAQPCEQYVLCNQVTLKMLDTCEERKDCARISICVPCDCGGCTYTIGYWKNHDGTKKNQVDMITSLIEEADGTIWLGASNGAKSVAVTDASQAGNLLSMENQEASNGIVKLYAQLLAAKLNILNGACSCAIHNTIAAADDFLSDHSASDWSCLTMEDQQVVLDWKTILDDYNNGVIGPGHCD